MSRQSYLEQRLEELEDRVAADARCLQQLTRRVDTHYSTHTRDSLISVAIRLYDSRVERQSVRDELHRRAQVEAQRLELLGAE